MADDLLGDILRATTGEAPTPSGSFGDALGRAVARPSRVQAAAEPIPDLAPLAALDEAGARAFLRYLPADQVVPLLARAPLAVAQRLVGAMDADARAWLTAQSDEVETVSDAAHRAAAAKAIAVLARLRAEAPAAVPAPAPAVHPVQVSAGFAIEPAAAEVTRPAEPPAAPEPMADVLADLVDVARGCRPGELRQLADGLDHPVLATGLGLVADGTDPHALDAALRAAAAEHLAAEERRLELIRQAVMAIRFGDRGDALRLPSRAS